MQLSQLSKYMSDVTFRADTNAARRLEPNDDFIVRIGSHDIDFVIVYDSSVVIEFPHSSDAHDIVIPVTNGTADIEIDDCVAYQRIESS